MNNRDVVALLRQQAKEITEAQHKGWGNTMLEAISVIEHLEKKLEQYREALIWCGGSNDFAEGGIARKGWLSICEPLIREKGEI